MKEILIRCIIGSIRQNTTMLNGVSFDKIVIRLILILIGESEAYFESSFLRTETFPAQHARLVA